MDRNLSQNGAAAATVRELNAALEQCRAELDEKDGVIAELRSLLEHQEAVSRELLLQLDKFRVVMKPLTEQLAHNLQLSAAARLATDDQPVELLPVGGSRLKRVAISAEPVDLRLEPARKIPKSDA